MPWFGLVCWDRSFSFALGTANFSLFDANMTLDDTAVTAFPFMDSGTRDETDRFGDLVALLGCHLEGATELVDVHRLGGLHPPLFFGARLADELKQIVVAEYLQVADLLPGAFFV